MSWSGLAKFFIGVFTGILLLVGGGAATAFYLLTKLSEAPPKPIFSEERLKDKPVAKATSASTKPQKSTPSSSPQISPASSPEEKLEAGAYKARITWSNGLSMRSEPSFDSSKIGGVQYNQQVVVLQESNDKKWQKVRVPDTNEEGWVKTGNIERVEPQ